MRGGALEDVVGSGNRFALPGRRNPGGDLDRPAKFVFSVGKDGGEDPVDACGGVLNDGLEIGVALHGGGVDDGGEGVTDVVVDFGGDLHAAQEHAAAADLIDHDGVGEEKSYESGVEVGGIETVCVVDEAVDEEAARTDADAGERCDKEDRGAEVDVF